MALSLGLHAQAELRLPGRAPATFARTLGDGRPLGFQVETRGSGTPRLSLVARPAAVERLLRPPGASTWQAAVRRRSIPGAALLERLIDARLRLVRADQYQAFLANPYPSGRNRTVYVYETAAASHATVARSDSDAGGNGLVVALVALGSIAAAGAALVLWAHS